MNELTPFQKLVYNSWLRTVRTKANLPYKPRVKFDDVKPSIVVALEKLSSFFHKYPHIDIECFFSAPYDVYVHDTKAAYTLEFFTTHKAISLYTSYLKMIRLLHPDHPSILFWIKRSFVFIGKYCIQNNITLDSYGSETPGSFVAPFLRHIKDNYITIYAMFAFPSAARVIHGLDPDVRQLMLGDIDVHQFAQDFARSKQAKSVATTAYKTLETYLKNRPDAQPK